MRRDAPTATPIVEIATSISTTSSGVMPTMETTINGNRSIDGDIVEVVGGVPETPGGAIGVADSSWWGTAGSIVSACRATYRHKPTTIVGI